MLKPIREESCKVIKEDMIARVARETGYSRSVVANVIETTLSNITFALSKGDKVQFSGFGTFEPKKRAARTGRNPHTKEAVPIPARVLPVFTAGKYLKNAVEKEIGGKK